MSKKPTVLMILDGFGLNDKTEGNAVAQANKPNIDALMKDYPWVKGNASGLAVGLPDGQMGNSEVGHMNMGAGRIVYQELTRITKEIEDGDFFKIACRHEKCKRQQFCTSFIWIIIRWWSSQPHYTFVWTSGNGKKRRLRQSICTLLLRRP